MPNPLFQEFSKYEDGLLKKYEQHPLFTGIGKLSNDDFVYVLTQYGEGISANFVKFLETALRQIENKIAQEAIIRILRDEIPARGPTHQQMRSEACRKIGINPLELAATPLTKKTHEAIDAYFGFLCNLEESLRNSNRDLELTTFVRVIGESLVGVVYRIFTQEIVHRFGVKESDITFYSFHWHHDEKGGTPFDGGDIGHTEYYDLAMEDLLKTDEDLAKAKQIADLALDIRNKFQDQFVG